jgi:hypothetical protein
MFENAFWRFQTAHIKKPFQKPLGFWKVKI